MTIELDRRCGTGEDVSMTSLIFNPILTTLWRGDIPASIRLVTSRASTIARSV
jgi:hypothetical protein